MVPDEPALGWRLGTDATALVALAARFGCPIDLYVGGFGGGDVIATSTVAFLAPDAVFSPGSDHPLEARLVALGLVGGHVAGAALVRLLFARVVGGPAAVFQVVLGLCLGPILGSGDNVAAVSGANNKERSGATTIYERN